MKNEADHVWNGLQCTKRKRAAVSWGCERESTKAVHQRGFVFRQKNIWMRSSSFYTHCSGGHASTVPFFLPSPQHRRCPLPERTHSFSFQSTWLWHALTYICTDFSPCQCRFRGYIYTEERTLISIVHAKSFLKLLAVFIAAKLIFFSQKKEDSNFFAPLHSVMPGFCGGTKWDSASNSSGYRVHETIALTRFHTVNSVLLSKHLWTKQLQPSGYLGPQAFLLGGGGG